MGPVDESTGIDSLNCAWEIGRTEDGDWTRVAAGCGSRFSIGEGIPFAEVPYRPEKLCPPMPGLAGARREGEEFRAS
jgi:hypothetical protein